MARDFDYENEDDDEDDSFAAKSRAAHSVPLCGHPGCGIQG